MKALSIIFQGPVGNNGLMSPEILQGLRKTLTNFPLAEIIVSTWKHSEKVDRQRRRVLAMMGIRLVLSDDPGPLIGADDAGVYVTNLNRQLRSAQAGLAAAARPLAVKLRTDTWLSSRALVPLLVRYVLEAEGPPRDSAFKVFSARVINASGFARDARGSLPYLFHPGDIFLAGRTDDIRLFFSAPLADDSLFAPASMPGLWCAWRYVPEQWFWVHAILAATGQRVYPGNFQYTPATVAISEQYFLANFVPFKARQIGLHWPKYWRKYPLRGMFSTMTPSRWLRLARQYGGERCLSVHILPDRLLTILWRTGYRLRTRLLRNPCIRKAVIFLFLHRR
ncbi:WavE lipopolysaccharide synthesis family protein [Enterobacter cloacae]|uniref:WavE lipopolysaccharide synthesis family protein n=1 Tax=Enterobacter cloacae TaxID=550 RepID=UPI00335ECB8A